VTKVRVDMAAITLGDLVEIEELTGKPVGEVLASAKGIAAAAYVLHRRDDPAFTYEQALALPMADLDIVNQDESGEARAAGNGGGPQPSPVPGG
jgi:hypothetical protein